LIRLCALAEAAGLPRIGIGLRSAVLGSDRVLVRRLLSQSEVQLALFRTFTRSQWEKDRSFHLIETELTLGYPCQVRPAAGWGMAGPEDYVQSREELEQLVDRLMTTHDRVIAEEVIEGRLFVAAVLNGQSSQVIGVGELLAAAAPVERAAGEPEEEPAEPADDPAAQAAALARRRAGEPPPWTRLEMPGEADRELAKVVRRAALKAAAALHLAGAALFYYQVPKGRPPVLLTDAELAPSLGPRSLYARLWAHSGGSYRELAACLVENGL
jgi:D-alanine-D-alanine ligase